VSSNPYTDPGWTIVRGPSALAGGPRRFFLLTKRIAFMEFKLRFFGSVLGYVWQLMRPLLLFGVLLAVFTQALPLGDIPHYPVMLLLGIVLFTFVAEAVSGSVSSVVDHENLVRKIHFPRLVIPTSVVLTAVFTLGLNLIVVAIFATATGVKPQWNLIEVPIGVLLLITFAFGLSMLVSALYVRFRDIQPITDVFLQAFFYATPILYPIEKLPEEAQRWMVVFNPFATIVQQLRHAAIDRGEPSAATVAGGFVWLLIPLGMIVAICVIGFVVFNRAAPRIAEDL
jgi:ABC-2 type transport system permease protein